MAIDHLNWTPDGRTAKGRRGGPNSTVHKLMKRVAYYVLRVLFSRATQHVIRNTQLETRNPKTHNMFTGPPKHPRRPFAQSPNRSAPRNPLNPTANLILPSIVIGLPRLPHPMKSGRMMPNFRSAICPVNTNFSYSPVLIPVIQTWLAFVHAIRNTCRWRILSEPKHFPVNRATLINDAQRAVPFIAYPVFLDRQIFRNALFRPAAIIFPIN